MSHGVDSNLVIFHQGISSTGPRIQNIYSHWNITSHSHVDELFVVFHEYETMSLSFFQSLSLLFQVQQVA